MTPSLQNFIFDDFDPSAASGVTLCLYCEQVDSKQILFDAYGQGLKAPGNYFGSNWDAFADCLMELGWIEDQQINIVHTGLPLLPMHDLVIYLDILTNAIIDWNGENSDRIAIEYPDFKVHTLAVYFPKSVKGDIEHLKTVK